MTESIYDYDYKAQDLWSECTFCEQFLSQSSRGISGKIFGTGFAREIYQDQHFVVVAALGQMVEGWLLIIPRIHCTSISTLPEQFQKVFSEITDRVRSKLQEIYGSVILFEHGSISQNGTAGACIEHAHLHVVPGNLDLQSSLSAAFELTPIPNMSTLWLSPPKQDYLYYETDNKECLLIQPNNPLPCQYFRRLVAEAIGCPDNWDWRTNIGTQTVRSVTEMLQNKI